MRARGWLIDVYETVVRADLRPVGTELAAIAGVPLDLFVQALWPSFDPLALGAVGWPETFRRTLRDCGSTPSEALVDELVETHARLLAENAVVFDDAAVLLARLRTAGARTALVSNCAPHTREMLEQLGLVEAVDHVVLSCEVGSVKPDPAIYRDALARLDVAPGDAVMVDDQARFCDGAVALGMAAVQIRREPEVSGDPVPWPRYDSLAEVDVEGAS